MDPNKHFTKEQIGILKEIYQSETNRLLVKIITANLITIVFAVAAVATGWYRLGHIEENLAAVIVTVRDGGTLVTRAETEAIIARSEQRDDELQRQVDAQSDTSREIKASVTRIEDKLDRYIFAR